MRYIYFPFLMISSLVATTGVAQSATTLSQAIHSAIDNRGNIKAGDIDRQIQQLKTKNLYKKYGPQVSAEYNYNYNPVLQSSIIPVGKFNSSLPPDATQNIQFGTTWSQSAGVTATQPLFDANTKRLINESLLQEKINSAGQAQSKYDLAYEVSKAYINVYLNQQQINSAIIDTSRTWLSTRLEFENYSAGRLLKSELNKSIINHNNTRQKLMDATIQLVENKIYLMYVTGTITGGATDFIIDSAFLNNNILLWVDSRLSLDSIPAFQQLSFQKQLTYLQQKTEKAKYLPVVSLKGFLGANQYTNDFNPVKAGSWFGYSYVGLNIKIPFLLGEDKRNKAEQLLLQAQQYDKQIQDKSAQYNQ
ncbi:MAG: TolC family protein, partial [Chitinophagaceae bacterium]